MKLRLGILLVALSLLALAPAVQAASTVDPTPSTGYATYSVQLTVNGTTSKASITETVSPAPTQGQSVVDLAVVGSQSNFTYSRIVNSSLTLFPYLPAISDVNYSYSRGSGSFAAKISQQGTTGVAFNGESYTLTEYSFSATYSDSNRSGSVTGTVSAFPSDLIYSVDASSNGAEVAVTLTSTSLPLSATSASAAVQVTSAGLGISLAVGAVALSLGVKLKNKPHAQGPKPDHWVD